MAINNKPPVLLPIGTAPALVRVNSLGSVTDDWRSHSFITSILSGGSVVQTLPTSMAHFIIETAGNYTANVTVDGISLPSVNFTVSPSIRTSLYVDAVNGNDANNGTAASPIKTLSSAISKKRIVSHLSIFLARGGIYEVSNNTFSFAGLTDVLLDCFGNAAEAFPVIYCTSGGALGFWSNSSFITVRCVKIDGPWTAATKTVGTTKVPYHMPVSSFGIVYGNAIIFDQVQLGNLTEGISIQESSGITASNILINELTQTDPLGLLARNIMVEAVNDLTVTNSTALNSINESPYRATGTGITRGFFYNTNATVDPVSGAGKAAFTIRQAVDLHCLNITANNNEFSVNWDITGSQSITASLFDKITVNNSQLDIRPGSRGNIFRNITVNGVGDKLPCVSVSAESSTSNTLENCQLYGDLDGIRFWNETGLTVSNVTFHTSSTTAPLFDGDTTSLIDAGGNTVIRNGSPTPPTPPVPPTPPNPPTPPVPPTPPNPPTSLGGISGIVFNDINGNGKQDSGETGIAGVTVYIDATNSGVFNVGDIGTITNADGTYSFSGFPAGDYLVRQVVSNGFHQTYPTNNFGNHVTLSAGQAATNINFGSQSNAVSISGSVVVGTTGMANVKLYIDLTNSGVQTSTDPSSETNAQGQYAFSGLQPGTYIVRQIVPAGYKEITPTNNYGNHVTVSSVPVTANFVNAKT